MSANLRKSLPGGLAYVRSTHSAAGLGKLLNSAEQPIYVLDKDLTIVFVNQACLEWLGTAAEALLGRHCAYHSAPPG